jgi:hypothetical protein
MKVVLTVDTELWPFSARWPAEPLPREKIDFAAEYATYIDGVTRAGSFGLGYQLELLERHRLLSTWFIEPLFSETAGQDLLRNIVRQVRDRNQEIGLHLHTEWLGEARAVGLPQEYKQFMRQFSCSEQRALIDWGRQRLLNAGAERISVFRAGSFGANLETIEALEALGITQDSSFNPAFASSFPDLPARQATAIHPFLIRGVQEFPVATFGTIREPGRNAQICACSSPELEHALLGAYASGWDVFVIFWHSGELVRRRMPNRRFAIHVRRFERLCDFLDRHRDKLQTAHFSDLASLPMTGALRLPLRVPASTTLRRLLEQAASHAF